MLAQEVIRRKRDGLELSPDEIAWLVGGITDGSVSDAQVGAFAMAVVLRGMTTAERVALTGAMTRSGEVLEWDLDRPVLDKHSTGGVGDKVSLLLAPIVAACGGAVPMISGRGLGHTGGTLDKLDAIPGYETAPSRERFVAAVRSAGCAIIGQTGDLAPADRRLYAIRDATGTVESIPLIVASILSKKLAAGLDGLVMDVKAGSGAFMPEVERARELARAIVETAEGNGLPTAALLTDMDSVLGRSAGNAVEDAMRGYRRLQSLALRLLEADGILVVCCCSGLIGRGLLVDLLGQLAAETRRAIQILEGDVGARRRIVETAVGVFLDDDRFRVARSIAVRGTHVGDVSPRGWSLPLPYSYSAAVPHQLPLLHGARLSNPRGAH